ncbi:tripartite tricarboxylate transporter TctB family protein [Thermodesulfobacteriota bacterium]
MKKRDLYTAACWVILGVVISIWSATFPFGTWNAVGPAVLPFGCGLILILLGSGLFFQIWKKNEEEPKEALVPLIPYGAAFRRVAITIGSMFLAAVLFEFLGFVLTVFTLTIFLLRGVQPKKWEVDIFYAFVYTAGCYILFRVLFKTTLPRGFIGF